MTLLSANGVAKHFGGHELFRDVEIALEEGARVGLIGANGTGKTTLLRILLGETDHEGTVARRSDLRIAVLEQNPTFPPGATVKEALLASDARLMDLEQKIRDLHERLADGQDIDRLLARLGELETEFERLGGYTVEHRADRVLEGIGFPASRHDEKVETLSGGERNRVAFARTLLADPDVWFLDEPTNHLDLDGILFLEETLREGRAAALIVSHDRRFLDLATTETWEIEEGRLWRYPAPYSRARELRDERILAAQRAFENQQSEISKQEEFIRRYQAGQRARQSAGRRKLLDRVIRLERPQDAARILALDFPAGESLGARACAVKELAISFGERTLFRDLSLEVEPGETLGIVGPNGAGKTSLLRVLLGDLAPTVGTVSWAPRAKPGTLRQEESILDGTHTPFTYLRSVERRKPDLHLRNALGAMLFSGDEADKPVSALSGGERKRLMLARLLFEGNNVLLLDEPTNHLDLPSREAIELALAAYEGTVLAVSHDRYFLDRIADRILWIEGGEWTLTSGGFEEAFARRRRPAASARPAPVKPPAQAPKKPRSPLARLRTEELEKRIIACEEQIRSLEAGFSDPGVFRNPGRLKESQMKLEATRRELSELELEYATRTR